MVFDFNIRTSAIIRVKTLKKALNLRKTSGYFIFLTQKLHLYLMLMQKQELSTEINKSVSSGGDFLLTIFYNDIYFRRKFITCSIQLSSIQSEHVQKIKLTVQCKDKTSYHFLEPFLSLGNIIAFLKHKFTNSIEINDIENIPLKVSNMDESAQNTSQNFVFFDCQFPLKELMNKSLDTEIIFIKNKQNLIFALVSSNNNNSDHYEFTEPYILIEKIISNIELIFKRNFKKEQLPYLQKGPTIWKNYIHFFENRPSNKFKETLFDHHYFLKMLKDISRIVNLLCLNNQFFITKRDLFILKDSEIFTSKLRELMLGKSIKDSN